MGQDQDDFYEPDEPVEDVIAAFKRGEKGRTGPHGRGVTATLEFAELPSPRGWNAAINLPDSAPSELGETVTGAANLIPA